jgi:hypothetical protein
MWQIGWEINEGVLEINGSLEVDGGGGETTLGKAGG